MTTTLKLKTLSFSELSFYIYTAAFVVGNVVLPQFFHTINFGGESFLPIILFSLIATMICGFKAGLVTAILSPLVSATIFGMPSPEMTVVLLVKGVAFVSVLTLMSRNSGISLLRVIGAIVAYQVAGFVAAALLFGGSMALNSMLLSYPAVLLQITAAYLILKLSK